MQAILYFSKVYKVRMGQTLLRIFGSQSDLYLYGLTMYICVPVIGLRHFWCFLLVACKRD